MLAAFAFVRLISALPITPGGLGVVELGYTAALARLRRGRPHPGTDRRRGPRVPLHHLLPPDPARHRLVRVLAAQQELAGRSRCRSRWTRRGVAMPDDTGPPEISGQDAATWDISPSDVSTTSPVSSSPDAGGVHQANGLPFLANWRPAGKFWLAIGDPRPGHLDQPLCLARNHQLVDRAGSRRPQLAGRPPQRHVHDLSQGGPRSRDRSGSSVRCGGRSCWCLSSTSASERSSACSFPSPSSRLITEALSVAVGRTRPLVDIIGDWSGYAHPSRPVAGLAVTLALSASH